LSSLRLESEAGNFSVMTRRVVGLINAMPERNRYLSGLRAFTGFQQMTIAFDRPGRFAGQPRMSWAKLVKLALDGIYSTSHLPVKFATWLGIGTAVVSLLAAAVVLFGKLFAAHAVPGWAPTTLSLLFLGAVQLICLGILGEYIVRIYDEVRQRPQYIVAEECLPGVRQRADIPVR
jgi:dolichol-phosphate mannosyltransferase